MASGGRGGAWLLLLSLLLGSALAGCTEGNGGVGGLGPNDPQLVIYRTQDNATQVVVRGAFKALEFDLIHVRVDNVTLLLDEHTYVATGKTMNRTFELDVRAVLDEETYVYEAHVEPAGQKVQITERIQGALQSPREEGLPFAKILEKQPPPGGDTG